MRSEEEIKKKFKVSRYWHLHDENKKGDMIDVEKDIDVSKHPPSIILYYGLIRGIHDTCKWALEGVPRFSVAELEKIAGSNQFDKWFTDKYKQDPVNADMQDLLDFLKDRKKVEEVLNEK